MKKFQETIQKIGEDTQMSVQEKDAMRAHIREYMAYKPVAQVLEQVTLNEESVAEALTVQDFIWAHMLVSETLDLLYRTHATLDAHIEIDTLFYGTEPITPFEIDTIIRELPSF